MTKLLRQYLDDPHYLLTEWGKYSRFFGCKGYHGGKALVSYNMDDDSATFIECALVDLYIRDTSMRDLVELHYIKGLNMEHMLTKLNYKKHKVDHITRYTLAKQIKTIENHLKQYLITFLNCKVDI